MGFAASPTNEETGAAEAVLLQLATIIVSQKLPACCHEYSRPYMQFSIDGTAWSPVLRMTGHETSSRQWERAFCSPISQGICRSLACDRESPARPRQAQQGNICAKRTSWIPAFPQPGRRWNRWHAIRKKWS